MRARNLRVGLGRQLERAEGGVGEERETERLEGGDVLVVRVRVLVEVPDRLLVLVERGRKVAGLEGVGSNLLELGRNRERRRGLVLERVLVLGPVRE